MIEIETFVSAELAGKLSLPAMTQVRFLGGSRGPIPAVLGRLDRYSGDEAASSDPGQVRMRIEISFETLKSLAPYFTAADRKAATELVTLAGGARVVLGRLLTLAEAGPAAPGGSVSAG